jgi:hypothetical protein
LGEHFARCTKLQTISNIKTQLGTKLGVTISDDLQAINAEIFLQDEVFHINTVNCNGSLISCKTYETAGQFGESLLSKLHHYDIYGFTSHTSNFFSMIENAC